MASTDLPYLANDIKVQAAPKENASFDVKGFQFNPYDFEPVKDCMNSMTCPGVNNVFFFFRRQGLHLDNGRTDSICFIDKR